MRKIIAYFCAVLMAVTVCGCKSNKPENVGIFKTEFRYDDTYVYAICENSDGKKIKVSNKYDLSAEKVYLKLGLDSLKNADTDKTGEGDWIDIKFFDEYAEKKANSTADFRLYSDNIIKIIEGDATVYYDTGSGSYKGLKKYFEKLSSEYDKVINIKVNENKMYECTLTNSEGKSTKNRIFKEKPTFVRVDEDVFEIRAGDDYETSSVAYFDRKNDIVSAEFIGPTDYLNGYICSYSNNNVCVTDMYDSQFKAMFNSFEKRLNNKKEMPVARLKFHNPTMVYIEYYPQGSSTAEIQYFNFKSILEGYTPETKETESSEVQTVSSTVSTSSETKQASSYTPPVNTSSNNVVQAFTSEVNARLEALSNTRQGHGWLKSEERQWYFAQYGAYTSADTSTPVVYLTFDEGYEYKNNSTLILNTLAEKGVKAVFFVTMDFAKKNPALIRRMIDEGHIIGNHSTTHPSFPDLTTAAAYKEIKTLHDYIYDNYGYSMNLFRFPSGEHSDRMLALVHEMGYHAIFWNFAHRDWETNNQPDPVISKQRIYDNTKNGTIYLLHAVSDTDTAILGEIIDEIRARGYTFGLLNEVV